MRTIIFDAGPLISLAMNNLLWILTPLKTRFGGEFLITRGVKRELIDRPLKTKKFKFEAMQTMKYVRSNILTVYDANKFRNYTNKLLNLGNSVFKTGGNYITIVQLGEIESIAAYKKLGCEAIVMDERTTRELIENPIRLKKVLERRLHKKITVNDKNLKKFRTEVGNIKIIRSLELATAAFSLGFLDEYLPKGRNARKELLDALLWGVKLNGCAVSVNEIKEIERMELR